MTKTTAPTNGISKAIEGQLNTETTIPSKGPSNGVSRSSKIVTIALLAIMTVAALVVLEVQWKALSLLAALVIGNPLTSLTIVLCLGVLVCLTVYVTRDAGLKVSVDDAVDDAEDLEGQTQATSDSKSDSKTDHGDVEDAEKHNDQGTRAAGTTPPKAPLSESLSSGSDASKKEEVAIHKTTILSSTTSTSSSASSSTSAVSISIPPSAKKEHDKDQGVVVISGSIPTASIAIVQSDQEQLLELKRDYEQFKHDYANLSDEQRLAYKGGDAYARYMAYDKRLLTLTQAHQKLCPKEDSKLREKLASPSNQQQYIEMHGHYRELLKIKIANLEWYNTHDKQGTIYTTGSGHSWLRIQGTEIVKRRKLLQWKQEELKIAEDNHKQIILPLTEKK